MTEQKTITQITEKIDGARETERQIAFMEKAAGYVQELSEKDYGRISDGQRQRVLLARAICQEQKTDLLCSYLRVPDECKGFREAFRYPGKGGL